MNKSRYCRFQQGQSLYPGKTRPNSKQMKTRKNCHRDESGFTLIELVIVTAILPLIVGALSVGLIAVFSLQSGVQNRLGDTADSQVVQANFQSDVQGAASITSAPNNSSSQCGPGTQLLGLAWGPVSGQSYPYQYVVSYVVIQSGKWWNLVRQYCSSGYSTSTPTSSTIISYDVPSNLAGPVVTVASGAPNGTVPGTSWISTQYVSGVSFPITEPNSKFSYTLDAVPASSSGVNAPGKPLAPATTAGCGFATSGTGHWASTLCLIDFSGLTGNNMLAATSGCLETSAPLPGGYTLYFCIGITGSTVAPSPLPTWQNAFLGNTCGGSTSCSTGTPFYTGIAGDPALYQTEAGTTTITISNISVATPLGTTATGWQVVGADAESSDDNESISFTAGWPSTWSGSTTLNILNNDESYDTPADPVGNACNSGAGLTTSNGGQTVTCVGASTTYVKTGTTMVEATMPSTFTTTLVGGGLEAMAFGLMLS